MTNEEKILEMLGAINDRIGKVESAQAQMQDDLAGVKATQTRMQDDLIGVRAILEVDVDRSIQALGEGHEGIVEKLRELSEVKELAEDTKDMVDVIFTVVKEHSHEITELKRAR